MAGHGEGSWKGRMKVILRIVGEEREIKGITEESELSPLLCSQGKGKMRTYWLLGERKGPAGLL